MNAPKQYLQCFHIAVNGRPYLGESDETVDASSRWTGWTGKSPAKRSRIKLGDFLSGPGKTITGKRCLRSELERILAEADAGLQIEKLEITGQ
jgi:hypothetical protein